MNNLWILTEERPKKEVLNQIIHKFVTDRKITCFVDTLRILPIINSAGSFDFTYEVIGYTSKAIDHIFLKIVSGSSSFLDFLVFFQKEEPIHSDVPIYGIEETKTDDAESRNTGVFQRATKFVFIDFFYPMIDKTMLYNLKIEQKEEPTPTNIFGSRCLSTLGVKFLGKKFNPLLDTPWNSIEEMIDYKAGMRKPPAGNVPIEIIKVNSDKITVSGRLFKSGTLSHDPNIGALSLICGTLRSLGWEREIEIIKHGLNQCHIRSGNKFIHIAIKLGLTLEGITLPKENLPPTYWHYEINSEKLGTIFLHVVVENFTTGMSIYENHAGCERGYFITKNGLHLTIDKKIPEKDVVNGEYRRNIEIPDLILIDFEKSEVINIEGKTYQNMETGIRELENFDAIEKYYVKKYYPEYTIIRTVVLYGGEMEKIERLEVSLLLNRHGKIILSIKAPVLFHTAIQNLKDFWQIKK
jgi:hypothetical protein